MRWQKQESQAYTRIQYETKEPEVLLIIQNGLWEKWEVLHRFVVQTDSWEK